MGCVWMLLQLLLVIPLTESHKLSFNFLTVWTEDNPVLPEHRVVAILDDVPILRYHQGSIHRLFPWMDGVSERHWQNLTRIAKHYERKHKETIKGLKRSEVKSLDYQARLSCEILADNTTLGFEEFAAHGADFIFLDNTHQKFMVAVNDDEMATKLVKEWNGRKESVRKQFYYKDQACLQWLRMYMDRKKEHPPNSVRPEVKVWGHQSDGVTKLQCLVYGFHPRAVDVKWVRNGTYDVLLKEAMTVLPHPDGTYQTRVSVEVPTSQEDSYSCHVKHSSLDEPIIEQYKVVNNFQIIIRLFTVGVLFVVVAIAVLALLVYCKIKGRENKALTEPD